MATRQSNRKQVTEAQQQKPELHPLYPVFMAAIERVQNGKGEIHSGTAVPFMQQHWRRKADTHGRGFLTGQASKKVDEAAENYAGVKFVNEMLDQIAYAGMSILKECLDNPEETSCEFPEINVED